MQKDIRQDWFTPASSESSLYFVRLIDDKDVQLSFTVEGDTKKYHFIWRSFAAYSNRFEEFGLPFDLPSLEEQGAIQFSSGLTHKVVNSSWKQRIEEDSGLLEHHHPNAQHYVICTCEYVFEVLSNEEPEIKIADM